MNILDLCSKHSPQFGTNAYDIRGTDIWKRTTQPVHFEYGTLPIGTEYRDFQSENFGYVVLKEYPETHDGGKYTKRIWRV
jgi:hypothetical protein